MDDDSKVMEMYVEFYNNEKSNYEFYYEINNRTDLPSDFTNDTQKFLERVKYF